MHIEVQSQEDNLVLNAATASLYCINLEIYLSYFDNWSEETSVAHNYINKYSNNTKHLISCCLVANLNHIPNSILKFIVWKSDSLFNIAFMYAFFREFSVQYTRRET